MKLSPGTPNMIWQAPVWKKRFVEIDPCSDAMGAENKIARGDKPGKKLEKPWPEFYGSGDECFIEPSLHDSDSGK